MLARATSRVHSTVAAVLFLIGAGVVVRPAGAQSLADLAKKEDDRRKTVAAPAKVLTNKDLNPVPSGSTPPATPAVTPADGNAKAGGGDAKPEDGKTADKGAAVDKGTPKDQAYWAGRLKTLQDALKRDQNYADAMQTRINALTTDFVNRDDPAQRAVIAKNRQTSVAELAQLNKSVKDTQKAIADLLEEARRAGVPPGWLR
jgi:hypothetical protein